MSLYLVTTKMVNRFPAIPTRNRKEHVTVMPVSIGTGKRWTGYSKSSAVALLSITSSAHKLMLNGQLDPFVQLVIMMKFQRICMGLMAPHDFHPAVVSMHILQVFNAQYEKCTRVTCQ